MTRSYYRGAAGALLVFDITKYASLHRPPHSNPSTAYSPNPSLLTQPTQLTQLTNPCSRSTFANLQRWLDDARTLASPFLVTVLVGAKSDREDDRQVSFAEASRWAEERGALCLLSTLGFISTLLVSCVVSQQITPTIHLNSNPHLTTPDSHPTRLSSIQKSTT